MEALTSYLPPRGPIEIIHEDGDLLVINKPAGLLSVPGRDPAHADCVEARLKACRPNALLVHRLDMDTSGVMVFAANPAAQRHLGLQFERRHLQKLYEALVWRVPVHDSGEADWPLIVDWPNRPLQKICHASGKPSNTLWHVLGKSGDHARLALTPLTGRSHQLRVHMKALGHPILGDRFYAHPQALAASERLCLHSRELTLRHPTGGEPKSFTAEVPF